MKNAEMKTLSNSLYGKGVVKESLKEELKDIMKTASTLVAYTEAKYEVKYNLTDDEVDAVYQQAANEILYGIESED